MKDFPVRSPAEKTGGLIYFARMIDKIRVHARGGLPSEYQANLGKGFDGRCARFLGIDYAHLVERVQAGGTDEELLVWCFEEGRKPSEEEIEVWSEFLRKCGWRDDIAETLNRRKREGGFTDRDDIQTMFDFIDADEGRKPLP